MRTKEYTNPKEAFTLMNQWTGIKNSYETQFQGKNIPRIYITFKDNQPQCASVEYKTNTFAGFYFIDLSDKMLLNQPEKPTLN